MLGVPADGAGENSAFHILTHGAEFFDGVGVVDALDVLFDDRSQS